MIITRSPFRISLFGGGTDIPAYYREHGGEVVGFSLDRYCWVHLRRLPPFFGYRHRIVWSKTELVSSYADIQHPCVREVMRIHGPDCGIELHHDGDLPSRSGLGSSSAFTVGLLHALYAFQGLRVDKRTLAQKAIHIEQEVLKENVGSQDQIWAAYGWFNHIKFNADDTFDVSPVILPPYRKSELQRSLMLFFTGFSRTANEIEGKKIANFRQKQRSLKTIKEFVGEALTVLASPSRPMSEIGELLDDSWRIKKELADGVSNDVIDTIYEAAKSAGAIGGKLIGAGGGGFLLLFVPEARQSAVKMRLRDLVNVEFEIGGDGSRVVLYEPNGFGAQKALA